MDSPRSSNSSLTMDESRSRPHPNPNLIDFLEARKQQAARRQRRSSSKLSGVYKTPQTYAGLKENAAKSHWGLLKTCMLLSPAIAFQFCAGLTSVYAIVNLHLMQIPLAISSAHLVLASIISIGLTIAFQKIVKHQFERQTHLAVLLVCFSAYLTVGTVLVIAANTEMLNSKATTGNGTENIITETYPLDLSTKQMKLDTNTLPNISNQFKSLSTSTGRDSLDVLVNEGTNYKEGFSSNISASSWQRVVGRASVPLYSKIMALIGYIIVTSSLSSSHYLLTNIVTAISHVDEHNSIGAIAETAAAVGGCAVTFLGATDLSSSWSSSKESSHLLIGHIVIILSIAAVLLIGCTACSLITWFSDAIIDKFRPTRDIEETIFIGRDRRPTRTAQEIFDECSALLGHQEQAAYIDEYLPSRNLASDSEEGISNSITQSETAMDYSIRPIQTDETDTYVLQLRVPVREQSLSRSVPVLFKTRKFIQALLLMFLVSGCLVSVEYNSSIYFNYITLNNDTSSGQTYANSVRISSASIFIMYLVCIAGSFFFDMFLPRLGWRLITLGACLVASTLTLALAISSEVPVYFAATGVLGLLRVLVVKLPRLVSLQSQTGSHTSTGRLIFNETAPTVALCMTPLSLSVASAVISVLMYSPGRLEASVYYSTASAALACVMVGTLF